MAYLINLHKTIDTSALLCYTRYIERKQTEKQRKKDAETDDDTDSAENTKYCKAAMGLFKGSRCRFFYLGDESYVGTAKQS